MDADMAILVLVKSLEYLREVLGLLVAEIVSHLRRHSQKLHSHLFLCLKRIPHLIFGGPNFHPGTPLPQK
jgi:hypothetical protein